MSTRIICVVDQPIRGTVSHAVVASAETVIRRGEVCALREQDVLLEIDGRTLEQAVVVVRRKVWNGKIGRPKSKRPRTFVLSPQLTRHLREFMRPISGKLHSLLFTNSEGGML